MEISILPRLTPIEGIPFSQTWQWVLASGDPVDLTDWTGEITFSRDRKALLSVPLALSETGDVELSLSAAQIALLVGPRVNFQINLSVTGFDPSEVWRGQVIVE